LYIQSDKIKKTESEFSVENYYDNSGRLIKIIYDGDPIIYLYNQNFIRVKEDDSYDDYFFNEKKISKKISYTIPYTGEINSVVKYFYDNNNNIIRYEVYDDSNELSFYALLLYDEKYNLIEEKHFLNGKLIQHTKYKNYY